METQEFKLDPETVAKHATDVLCTCGHKIFHQAFILKELSAIVSPNGVPILIPIDVIVCDKCGELVDKRKK